ncbi:hypothetical protein EMIHUDRAFT_203283 [Emiliania huxleyi CCMP1516]|uniref:Uncharacterized protein n=2 Tax=Emiliania huxleyi TaxID=2903 RepID=A0A0D3K5W0_EMIH1|nr:hypothetical protein EMIHUDRAFT_203283 [Emiliania huxleyi CCMP1516]EOD31145.1 hypothetical protein EMIHUDRAFT_203283 [Emiliania huxleyi CCMP1516]|eukprot:XP_005783574.1 hypothetical protein EMIHUDRAFT_203283 [Emiliania huxleyi CCMP1516]
MAGEAVTAMIVAADAGDNPLADRREDREAAAAREKKAKVAKLNSQTANAMEVVRAQQAAKERGAFDEAALRANEVAGAPVKGTSSMVESIFASRRESKDRQMVQRREQRKTQTGAGTGAQVVDGLEKVAASAIEMYQKGGADALTAVSNYPQFVSWLATFATFVQCFYPSCGWRHNLPLDGSGGKPIAIPAKLVVLYLAMVANGLVPIGGFVCDFEDGSASFAARGGRVPHSKSRPLGGNDMTTSR